MPTKTMPAPQPDTIGAKALDRIAGYKQETARLRGLMASEKRLFGWGFDDVPGVRITQGMSDDIHTDELPPDGRGSWMRLHVRTRQEAVDLVDRMKPYAIPLVLTAMRYEYDHPVLPADCLPQGTGTHAVWHGVWWFLKKTEHCPRAGVELHCWLKKGNERLHVVIHVSDPWDETQEGTDFTPFCPDGCQSAESCVYHFAFVPPKGKVRLAERYPGMIPITQSQPSTTGTYRVRLDNGRVTKAYWTGQLWMYDRDRNASRQSANRFNKMVREWECPA